MALFFLNEKGCEKMFKYVMKRLGYALVTVIVLIVITYIMIRMAPGNPFDTGGRALTDAQLAALNAQYGFDKPIWQQVLIYIGNVFQGDLGRSTKYGREVTDIIMEAFPVSFELGIRSLLISVTAGVGLGTYAAIRRGKKGDSFAMGVAVVGVSVPSFIVAALLQYFVSLKLNQWTGTQIFPVTGWDSELSKILPAIALSFGSLATISRLMRTSMLDVLNCDYIKTAKAKGLSEKTIVFRHAVRNAIMPVITVLGPITAAILTGAFVVEQVFSIPGMGKYFVIAIKEKDYMLTAGTTIFYGTFLVLATLVVDIMYGVVDPRVKITAGKE